MKFYCSVSTKNIQVNITPIIPRFTRVCRYLTLSEIGSCLSCGAEVIHITNKGNSLLNKTNYAIILTNLYKSNSNDSTKHTSKINVIETHFVGNIEKFFAYIPHVFIGINQSNNFKFVRVRCCSLRIFSGSVSATDYYRCNMFFHFNTPLRIA